ncbi:MAG: helix-turn-helix domain-containing protein [Chloroflexota bacterium]
MDTEHKYTFGNLLRDYRIAANLSQETLAERAGVSARSISSLERGIHQKPHLETVRRLADALSLPPDIHISFSQAARGEVTAPPKSAIQPGILPTELPPFFGRETEITALSKQLTQDTIRLVTLTGLPGVGKTRLAIRSATSVRSSFRDGVYFVRLAQLRHSDQVIPTIAHTFGLYIDQPQQSYAQLTAYLQTKQILLVLDNFEHMRAAAPNVVDLLTMCPYLTILVTSRIPLSIYGEYQFPVTPFPLPSKRCSVGSNSLHAFPAVALFVARAQAINPTFIPTAQDIATISTICHRLEGIPLAIELAAAWIKVLSPSALLTHLDNRFTMLANHNQAIANHHHTLHDALLWSYHLLPDEEQTLLQHLAVFVGGWTLEAAQAITTNLHDKLLPSLAMLVDHNLIQKTTEAAHQPRFTMLEIIREFAFIYLCKRADFATICQRHAVYFLTLIETDKQKSFSQSTHQDHWLGYLNQDYYNLRVALRWAEENCTEGTDTRIAHALWQRWSTNLDTIYQIIDQPVDSNLTYQI